MIKAKMNTRSEMSLTEIFANARKHAISYWRWYLACIIIGLICSWLYLRYTSPDYLVQAKILIKDENSGLGGGNNQGQIGFDLFNSDKVVENELEIIKSRPVVEEAIITSNSQVKIYRKARIRNVPVTIQFPFRLIPLHHDSIAWAKPALLHFNISKNEFTINQKPYPLHDGSRIVVNAADTFTLHCQPSQLAHWDKSDFQIQINKLNDEVGNTIQAMEVKTSGGANSILELTLHTPESSVGLSLLNAIITAYNRSALADKRMIAQYTLNFIGERLALVTSELEAVEQNLENYKSKNEIIDVSEQSKFFLQAVQDRDAELNKLSVQLSVLDEAEKYIKGKGNNPGSAPSILGIEDPLLLDMLPKLYAAEFELNKQKQITGAKDDATIVLSENVLQLKRSISEVIANLRINLESAEAKLKTDLAHQNELLKMLPSKERALVNISRQQAIKNSIYTFLLEKREESAIAYASTVSNTRLIEPCYGTGVPVTPKPIMIFLIGLVFGILAPFFFIFIREKLNTKIQQRGDIQHITSFPIIGEILFDTDHKDFVISEKSRSQLAEAFRAIRTKLSYYVNAMDKKVLLVSSSIPGEGKTFFTLNTGRSYALTGKRTILVTADMRKPTLHKIFNLEIKKGLSNYLVNMATADEIIYSTGIENLFIIPVGPLPPNPSELLTGNKMAELILQLREQFDLIIIDTPPLGLISDPELIAPLVDASIFLTRHNHTPKEIFEKVMNDVATNSIFKNNSIIFNGIKTSGFGYRNKYGYGYGYGYTYGQEQKKRSIWQKVKRIFAN